VLDLAEAAGVVLDLAAAQTVVARWWQETRPRNVDPTFVTLRDRLELSPRLSAGE
jgi:hypothetical protein